MPRYASDRMPQEVQRRYFELIREGLSGSEAAREFGVLLSCGSKWFIEAGNVTVNEEVPISSRYFSQDDRIEIADDSPLVDPCAWNGRPASPCSYGYPLIDLLTISLALTEPRMAHGVAGALRADSRGRPRMGAKGASCGQQQ
jgi:hypothetical protein